LHDTMHSRQMKLRNVTKDDYQKLTEFWKENNFLTEMDNESHYFVFPDKNPIFSVLMEEKGEIIGSSLGSYDGRREYLQKVVIKKEIRKKGIGRQLVFEVVKRLKNAGALYIPICVNEELIPFYETCGFVKKDAISIEYGFIISAKRKIVN